MNLGKGLSLIAAAVIGGRGMAADDPETFKNKEQGMDRFAGLFPAEIKCVALISPATTPRETTVRYGIDMLERAGLKVKLMPHALTPHEPGQDSAPLADRLSDWNQAVNDPEVDMILCTRGGVGSQDLLDHIDWEQLKARDLPVLGYSNITMLTGAMLRHQAGYPLAGPTLGSLISVTPEALAWLKATLAGGELPPMRLDPLRKGDARGLVYSGHLALLDQLQKRPEHKVDTTGRIVFIECVRREAPVLRELLESLYQNGFFTEVNAVVFCHFSRVQDPAAVSAMLEDFSKKLACPVYKGFPYGHEPSNFVLDFHRTAVIQSDILTFEPPNRPLPYRKRL